MEKIKCENCGKDNFKYVKKYIKGGFQARQQCQTCGCISTKSFKQEGIELFEINQELYEKFENQKKQEHQEFIKKLDEEKEKRRCENFEKLSQYYKTYQWQKKRAERLDFNRLFFNGFCERCNTNTATTVHHRSYELLGLEHTFDLEAICKDCHTEIHPHLAENEGN